MPTATEIERRDRAVVAFALLTGARDGAMVSLKLKHVEYLVREKLFGLDDPLFPATEMALNADHQFAAVGLSRRHWRNMFL